MSERNVKLFYNEMCKNEKLQNEIKEVLGGAKTESDKQALLNDIAKKYNFIFTSEEAKKFAENLSGNELSLDDLSEVSGGFGRRTAILAFTALTTLGSLGSAGAIVSHAAPPKNRQTQSSSTDKPKKENDKKGENDSKNYIVIDDSSDEIDTENVNNSENNTNNLDMVDNSITTTLKEEEKIVTNGVEIEEIIVGEEFLKKEDDKKEEKKPKAPENEENKKISKKKLKIENNQNHNQEINNGTKKKSLERSSEIINENNINKFEGLVCPTRKLKLLYRMTEDGANRKAMQDKLDGHSNIVVLVKTNEDKIFGGYTSCKIEYDGEEKNDNKAFLFSLNLNKKLNIKEKNMQFLIINLMQFILEIVI